MKPESTTAAKLRALAEQGINDEAAKLGRGMLANGGADTASLRLLTKVFAETGDEASERIALDALRQHVGLSSAKQRRLAQLHLKAGDIDAAVSSIRRLIDSEPGDADIAKAIGWLEEKGATAEALPLRQLICGGANDDAANRLVVVDELLRQGRRDEAASHLRAATNLPASDAKAAAILQHMFACGRTGDALAYARDLRRKGPDAYVARSPEVIADAEGDSSRSELGAMGPKFANALAISEGRIGRKAAAAGQFAEGAIWFQRALKIRFDIHDLTDLIECLLETGATGDAIATARASLDRVKSDAQTSTVLMLLGKALRYAHRFEEARSVLEEAVAHPSAPAATALVLFDTLQIMGKTDEALSALTHGTTTARARRRAASTLFATNAMRGHMEEAYEAFAARTERDELNAYWPPSDPADRPVTGRNVLFIAEGGVADEIEHMTCLAELVADAAHVEMTCDPRFESMVKRSFSDVDIHPVFRFEDRPRQDMRRMLARMVDDHVVERVKKADVTLLGPDIYRLYRPSLDTFTHAEPPLRVDPVLRQQWRERLQDLKGRARIGFCWRSGKLNHERREHYTSITDWRSVFDLEEVAFVNLQHDATPDELAFARSTLGDAFVDWNHVEIDLKNDFENLFALLSELDLVVGPNITAVIFAASCTTPAIFLRTRPYAFADWRRETSGRDRFFPSALHVSTETPFDTASLMRKTAGIISSRFGLTSRTG